MPRASSRLPQPHSVSAVAIHELAHRPPGETWEESLLPSLPAKDNSFPSANCFDPPTGSSFYLSDRRNAGKRVPLIFSNRDRKDLQSRLENREAARAMFARMLPQVSPAN